MNPDSAVLRLVELFNDPNATSICSVDAFNKAKQIIVYDSDLYKVLAILGGNVDTNLYHFTVFFKQEYTNLISRQVEGSEFVGDPIPVKDYKQVLSWVTREDSDTLLGLISLIRENEDREKRLCGN